MVVSAPTQATTGARDHPFTGEWRFRLFAAAALVSMQTLAAVGLGWDIQWHRWLGRDAFLTPPHLIIYTGVIGAGLICITVVLVETGRYWRRVPGVDRTSTVSLLGVFHAPLGFVLAGFGALTMALAAPLDNYWHQLYGVDVTLWSPFHMMGLIGAGIAYLGAAYALASELVRSRRDGRAGRRVMIFGWPGIALGALFALTGLLRLVRVLMEPSIETFPTWQLGPVEVLTSPIGLTLAVAARSAGRTRSVMRPPARRIRAANWVITTLLRLLQPLARTRGRLGGRSQQARSLTRRFVVPSPRVLIEWTESWQPRERRLGEIERRLRAAGGANPARSRRGIAPFRQPLRPKRWPRATSRAALTCARSNMGNCFSPARCA